MRYVLNNCVCIELQSSNVLVDDSWNAKIAGKQNTYVAGESDC